MNWLDIAILVVIAFAGLQARGQGLVRALLPLAGVIAGTLVAGLAYEHLANNLSTIVTDPYDARVVGFLALFGAVYLGSQLAATLMGPFVALLLLGPWTRTAGMLLGLLTGFLFVDTLLIFLVTYPSLGLDDAVHGSRLASVFVNDFPVSRYLLPNEFDAAAAGFQRS